MTPTRVARRLRRRREIDFVGTSADGHIVRPEGAVEWLGRSQASR